MTFYILSIVARVDSEGRALEHAEDGGLAVKEVPVWDERTNRQLAEDYAKHGSLHLRKLGYQHSKGRPLEWRGEISVFAPYLISIDIDAKAQSKQPAGPVDYVARSSNDLNS